MVAASAQFLSRGPDQLDERLEKMRSRQPVTQSRALNKSHSDGYTRSTWG